MTKEMRKQGKAVKKLDKAVRKAVDKGVSQSTVESAVDAALVKVARKAPAKKSALLKDSDPYAEPVASKPRVANANKLAAKHKPPTLTHKRGKDAVTE